MNYGNASLRTKLAAEYVLGTLHGAARRRFERVLARDDAMRAAVNAWERRLLPLTEALAPVTPPARVWRAIERRLDQTRRRGIWQRLDFWRAFALATGAVAALLLVYIGYLGFAPPSAPTYVALLADQAAQPAWVVSVSPARDRVTVKNVRPQPLAARQAFELWLIPGPRQAPQSLGLIPASGAAVLDLPERMRAQIARAPALAVSLEPAGGSPTGQPTGPVLYQGALVSSSG